MTFIRITADGLASMRFALSPLAETLATTHEAYRQRHPEWVWLHQDPFASGLFSLLTQTKLAPTFVAIPPTSLDTRIEDELALMRAVPDAAAHHTLAEARARSWDTHDPAWLTAPRVTHRVAEVFHRAWRQVEPDWERRRTILERDIRYRAGFIATDGWQSALADISPKVRWDAAEGIRFSGQRDEGPSVGGEGLTLVPHTLTSGRWICEAPPQFAMVYPARGSRVPAETAGGGNSLLGATRTAVLELLESPTTPSQLSVLTGRSLGTIAGHLARLEQAGVVHRTRLGRSVHYERTPRGDLLIAALRH